MVEPAEAVPGVGSLTEVASCTCWPERWAAGNFAFTLLAALSATAGDSRMAVCCALNVATLTCAVPSPTVSDAGSGVITMPALPAYSEGEIAHHRNPTNKPRTRAKMTTRRNRRIDPTTVGPTIMRRSLVANVWSRQS